METFEPTVEHLAHPGVDALMKKLEPLLVSGRMDNIIDLLSLGSDLVDLLDTAMVDKLAQGFEDVTALTWTVGNALRMAQAQSSDTQPPSLLGLVQLLREPQTRRGIALMLRVLNNLGRQY